MRLNGKDLKLLLFATFFNCLYSVMFFVGLHYGSAGKGGVLVTTMTPIFVCLFASILRKIKKDTSRKMKAHEILGLCLGVIAGVCLLNLGTIAQLLSKFNLFFILCAMDWAVLTLICQRTRVHPIAINFYTTLFSVLFSSVIFAFQPAMFEIFSFDGRFWVMMAIVAVLSTAIGTSIYYLGIAQVGAEKASSYPLLVPAFALFTSYVILGEIPRLLTLIGGGIAVCAIYFINLYRPSHFEFFFEFLKNLKK